MVMEKKKFDQYTKEEKIKILEFWFYYYGKTLVTLDEIHEIDELIETNPDRIFDYIAISYLANKTIAPTVLLQSMAMGELEKLFDSVPRIEDMDVSIQDNYRDFYYGLVDEIVHDMNNPQPSVPMDIIITASDEPKGKK